MLLLHIGIPTFSLFAFSSSLKCIVSHDRLSNAVSSASKPAMITFHVTSDVSYNCIFCHADVYDDSCFFPFSQLHLCAFGRQSLNPMVPMI